MAVARRDGRYEDETWHAHKDGSLYWAAHVMTTLVSEDGPVNGYLIISRDLTERRRTEQELVRLARRDPLTGLPNHRAFDEELNRALSQAH